ncbi:hypothetical protein FM125_05085 [Micrococcus lylae]|uniref:Uncharacterized protein n=1 Tax=Micrococcus lylae TaxID=1273 RepID=A0A1R4IXX0_9MICC|nr:hypothetical protein FM125_05085 [Micrococcus lylae]
MQRTQGRATGRWGRNGGGGKVDREGPGKEVDDPGRSP